MCLWYWWYVLKPLLMKYLTNSTAAACEQPSVLLKFNVIWCYLTAKEATDLISKPLLSAFWSTGSWKTLSLKLYHKKTIIQTLSSSTPFVWKLITQGSSRHNINTISLNSYLKKLKAQNFIIRKLHHKNFIIWGYRRTDGRTDGRTELRKSEHLMPPWRGHKKD